MTESSIHVQVIFENLKAILELCWIGGRSGADRMIQLTGKSAPVLAGRLDWIYPPAIQIIGQEEFRFLNSLDEVARSALIRRLLAPQTGAVIVCQNPAQAETLRTVADETGTPLWHTVNPLSKILEQLVEYQRSLGISTLLHGELLEVFGLGVLLMGSSGSGKSELALELISRGHRLIADDTPRLTRVAPNVIEGTCPPSLRDFLEVRGLGILNIRRMFGDSAIKRNKRVRLIINLVRSEEMSLPPELRLHGARDYYPVLDVSVPMLSLPIAPGRNLAVLVECAVRDHIQRLNGYHADQDLTKRLRDEMAKESACE